MSDKRCLGSDAYGGCRGEDYAPYVHHSASMREFTLRSVLIGIFVGIIFGAANAYLGLQVGITVSASIPAAVIAVALSRAFGRRPSVLENNMVQTVGSAGESLAGGIIFTIPALIVLGFMPQISRIFILSIVGGLLGVLFMIPLRRYLMLKEHGALPFPEGTACAEVLVAGDTGGERIRRVMTGVGFGAVYTFLMQGLGLWPNRVTWSFQRASGATIGADLKAALLGVGYVIGPRIAGVMLAGGAVGWLVLIPMIKLFGEGMSTPIFPAEVPIASMGPSDIWNNYIRYIGAGAVAFGGIITLVRAIPTMVSSFGEAIREMLGRRKATGGGGEGTGGSRRKDARGTTVAGGETGDEGCRKRTSIDIPLKYVVVGAVVLGLVTWLVPAIPVNALGALLIVVFSFFFVTVASRIVGLVGSSSMPASGMTIATLLGTSVIFLAMGWTGPAGMVGAITVGAVVCIAICISSDTSQDLKTGFLIGATPWRQQIGEIIGVLSSAIFIGWVVLFLHDTYGIGSEELPAPQAVLMSMVVRGVLTMSLPWTLVLIGALLAGCVELLGVPSLPFAVGLYLPIRLSVPIMVGGMVRLFGERAGSERVRQARRENGVLMSSGLIAGGAIIGLLVAWFDNIGLTERISFGSGWAGVYNDPVAIVMFALLTWSLVRVVRARSADDDVA
ncbi:oligopeptide transporter, OPT family [bacterium]|nr:oligopeptide transporter, OPT family [bacterium]